MSATDVSQTVRIPAMLSTPASPDRAWLPTVLGGAALLAIFAWFFSDFLMSQVRFAISAQADWGHTLIIPFIAAYLAYFNRERLAQAGFRTTWIGLVPIILGAAAYMVCAAGPPTLRHHNLLGASIGLSVIGIALLFCGWRAMRWLWFPLLFMIVFSQTISERFLNIVTFRLQDITARGGAILLSLFLDVDRSGNTITIFNNGESIPLNIAEACSGMRMLMAFLALGTVMAYTGLRHRWQQVLLVLLGVPTAIFVNILRVCTLGVLTMFDAGLAAGDFHSFIGLLWLLPAFLIYMGLMWIISHMVIDEPSVGEQPVAAAPALRFDARAGKALIACCATLLICGVGFRLAVAQLNIYLRKQPVEMRETFATLPSTLGSWTAFGTDVKYDEAMLEQLGTRNTISRSYVLNGDARGGLVNVHIAYYTGMIDAIPHVPDRCFVAAGLEPKTLSAEYPLAIDISQWPPDDGPPNHATGLPYHVAQLRDAFTNRPQSVLMPVGDIHLRVTEFTRKDQPGVNVFGGFFFIANGRATATPEAIRLLAFKPSERYAYYCKVQLVWAAPNGSLEDYLTLCSSIVQNLLPELMLRLPDWREVESRIPASQSTPSIKKIAESNSTP